MADLTPAEELRGAVTRLRRIAESDADWTWMAVSHPGLAETLAAWLEDAARTAGDHQQMPDYAGLPDHRWCLGCQDEECDGLRATDKALAVARVINGAAEQPGGEPAPAEQPVRAADLRPGMVVSHPAWNGGHRVRIVTAHDDGSQVVIHYRDVRVRRPDAVVVVPLTFEVTPGAGFEPHTTPTDYVTPEAAQALAEQQDGAR